MKTTFKHLIVFSLIFLGLSCQQENAERPLPEVSQRILNSKDFNDLSVSPSLLNLYEPSEQPTKDGNAVVLHFKATDTYKKVIAFLNDKNEIRNVLIFEVQSSLGANEIESAIRNGSFTGTFLLTTPNKIHAVAFNKSKLLTIKKETNGMRANMTSPEKECEDMRAAYLCVAESIDSMGPFSYAACIIELPVCMAVLMADCLYRDCPNGGV
jgi:hypothetical protein